MRLDEAMESGPRVGRTVAPPGGHPEVVQCGRVALEWDGNGWLVWWDDGREKRHIGTVEPDELGTRSVCSIADSINMRGGM